MSNLQPGESKELKVRNIKKPVIKCFLSDGIFQRVVLRLNFC